jgi:peptidoglycan hydrolase-like protein with peptidoglycan-binding domain
LPPATPAPSAPAEPKVLPANWPCPGYTGPQPWEAENPPELTQSRRMVGSGSAGEEVAALAELLGYLGFPTSLSAGQNPSAMFDDSVRQAVAAFCAEYGVEEDPQVKAARTPDVVGPWLWEALTRAVYKRLAAAQEQG